MFAYNRIGAFSTNPNHVTTFASYPTLREEDVSFYGLLTYGAQHRVTDTAKLPGRQAFQFTDRDRGILTMALRKAGIRPETVYLEVCTVDDVLDGTLVESNLYEFWGKNQHGLEIVRHSLGTCSLGLEQPTRQQG